MDDIDESVDFNALVNVLLPLDLYRQAPFPGEQSFDRLRQLIFAHFPRSAITSPRITPGFLFSICNILLHDTQPGIPLEKIFPAVLRCMKPWRLLLAELKALDDTVETLALNLARLVNCRGSVEQDTDNKHQKRLRVRWIGADSEYTDVRDLYFSNGKNTAESPVGVEDEIAKPSRRLSNIAHVCSNAPLHETAAFRSGCCCCRKPRSSISTHHVSISSVRTKITEPLHRIGPSLPTVSKDTLKPSSKVVDENIPPASSGGKPSRHLFKSSTLRRTTLTDSAIPPTPGLPWSQPAQSLYSSGSNYVSPPRTSVPNIKRAPFQSSSSANLSIQPSGSVISVSSTSARVSKNTIASSSSRTSVFAAKMPIGTSKHKPIDVQKMVAASKRQKIVVPASSRVLRPRKGQA
jgi:hypothetical protein